ncbi:MAG: hypothetical protein MI808_21990 [Pseudomonadales bacterium]|nr:hypothetical protein [Pseudomonadales bacterium]
MRTRQQKRERQRSRNLRTENMMRVKEQRKKEGDLSGNGVMTEKIDKPRHDTG